MVYNKTLESHAASIGMSIHVRFQASSDDEGVMVTLWSYTSDFKMKSKIFLNDMKCIKQAVDRKFGVKTSWEKTTIAVEDVYEFNSLWYFGNTTVSPLIKLVATVCNDTPEESISKRVSNLLSQNFALRESGAKGSLCSIISGAQVIALQRNLGRGTMTWWDAKCENLYRTGLTAVGGLKAFSPIEAGLVDTMLLNYDVLRKNPEPNKNSSLAMKLQLYSSLKEDDIPNLKNIL